jgi:hypothetical protein
MSARRSPGGVHVSRDDAFDERLGNLRAMGADLVCRCFDEILHGAAAEAFLLFGFRWFSEGFDCAHGICPFPIDELVTPPRDGAGDVSAFESASGSFRAAFWGYFGAFWPLTAHLRDPIRPTGVSSRRER